MAKSQAKVVIGSFAVLGIAGLAIYYLMRDKKDKGAAINDCPPGFMAFMDSCVPIQSDPKVNPPADIPKIPQPKDSDPEVEPVLLNSSRKATADLFIKNQPMNELAGPATWHHYQIWASAKQKDGIKPYYQMWLANQIYWKIARNEKKSDWDVQSNVNAPFPFLLNKGKKVDILAYEQGTAGEIPFNESDDQFKARASNGITLWGQIYDYVKSKIGVNNCPMGAFCG